MRRFIRLYRKKAETTVEIVSAFLLENRMMVSQKLCIKDRKLWFSLGTFVI